MRVVRYTPAEVKIGDIERDALIDLKRTETLNGENFLSITTTQVLDREERLLTKDGMGVWREYVVTGVDEEHADGDKPFGTYYATWSLMHDLALTVVDAMPGTHSPVMASVALTAALSGTSRWNTGTVTQTTTGGASMYFVSGWEALGILVDNWGGELAAQITVNSSGVATRRVALYSRMGKENPTRRFEYGKDTTSIRRKVDESPVACRVLPRGKGEESGGGYGRKITIESVNGGVNYLQDSYTASAYRLPDGSGGWEYPTVIIENGDCETPLELKTWAQSVMEQYTRPKVTYEASVVQLAAAGMDITGVALGDTVQCVDRKFGSSGLRVTGRVVQMVTNMLDETDVKVKIGYLSKTIAEKFRTLQSTLSQVKATTENMNGGNLSTEDYLTRLLGMINTEINATGGWTYITEGYGMRTYSVEVSDPIEGAEAKAAVADGNGAVVEIKGGTIRIANSLNSSGDWDWRTVFTSGHIAADVVTAARLTSGKIQSADGKNFWDLDTGEIQIKTTSDGSITFVQTEYGLSNSDETPPTSWKIKQEWEKGKYLWQRQKMTFADGDVLYSTPNIAAGPNGAGIKSVKEQFYQSTSSTMLAGGTWSDTQQAYDKKKYYWVRVVVEYSDGSVSYSPSKKGQLASAHNASRKVDDSLTQREIFDRLTTGGKEQGIYLSGGKLYLNGTYLKSNTVQAGMITSGIFTDKKKKNSWNLNTGVLNANNINALGSFRAEGRCQSGLLHDTRMVAGNIQFRYYDASSKSYKQQGCITISDYANTVPSRGGVDMFCNVGNIQIYRGTSKNMKESIVLADKRIKMDANGPSIDMDKNGVLITLRGNIGARHLITPGRHIFFTSTYKGMKITGTKISTYYGSNWG